MNAFAENPLFLFMDNLSPPIIAVKNPRETRKIVELSDTGCDARITVPIAGRKSNSCRPPRLPNTPSNEKSKFQEENKPYERYERTAMESDERCFVSRNGGFVQPCWQKHSAYEDFDETGHRRRSHDSRQGTRVLPEAYGNGNRRRRDDDGIEDPYRVEPSTVRYVDREPPRQNPNDPYSSQRRPGNNNLGPRNGSKYTNPVYPTLDTDDTRSIRSSEIHPYFEDNHPFRNRNEHWPRCNFFNSSDHEDFYQETSLQRNHRCPRYGPRDERPASCAGTPNDVSRDWDDRNYGIRTRSRTCSPPRERRKRTQTYPKGRTFYEEEHLANTQQIFSNNLAFPTGKAALNEAPKRYVDRAVDKDSLSDLHHTGTSMEPTESGYIAKCAVRTNFWDFIPLDDDNDKKSKSPSVERNTATPVRRQPAPLSKDTVPRSKRRASESIDANPSRPEFVRSAQKSQACRKNDLNQRENVRRRPRGSNLNTEENKDTVDAHDSKSRIKVTSRLNFGWLGKNRADLKRPGRNSSPAKSESSDEQNKKKRMDGGYVTNICEKTVASLKRKLDKSDGEKASAATAAYSITEKKTRSEESSCSRLPLRIANRLRSRNPMLYRINQKDNMPQETKREDSPTRLNLSRSRTKPKTKSSLLASEVADLIETSEHGRSIGEGGGEREGGFAEEKSRSIGNDVDAKERSLEETSQAKPMDSKNVSEAETCLENDFMDEIDQPRIGLKDKCCFQIDDEENMICSSSYEKGNGNLGPTEFHPRKHAAAIRTQF